MNTSWVLLASNKPDKVVKHLRHYQAFDKILLYAHENQRLDFEAAFQAKGMLLPEILYHNIPGPSPMGGIRYYSIEALKQRMGRQDFCIVCDDDLQSVRLADSKELRKNAKGIMPSYPICKEAEFEREIRIVADEACGNFPFFTTNLYARAGNGYKFGRPFLATHNWSGLLGFFKSSLNPFNPLFGPNADYDAQFRAIQITGTLPVLKHCALVTEYNFESEAYRMKGNFKCETRKNATLAIEKEFRDLVMISENNSTGVLQPKLKNDVLLRLKHGVAREYR